MSFCFCPLRSGSSGNALFVQAGGVRILVDAGLSARTVEQALRDIGAAPDTLGGILVTHEHSDHIRGVGILSKRWALPVYATEKTWAAMKSKPGINGVALKNRRAFAPFQDFYIRDLAVSPFSIPHDAADPVGFSLLYGSRKICVATDLGHVANGWMRALSGANLVLIEANHDPRLLQASARYPERLKRRILGNKGHLSNQDCGEALSRLVEEGVRHAILGHMSAETNTPELAKETILTALITRKIRIGTDIQVDLALREETGSFYTIE